LLRHPLLLDELLAVSLRSLPLLLDENPLSRHR
jgi:hypothetical protein